MIVNLHKLIKSIRSRQIISKRQEFVAITLVMTLMMVSTHRFFDTLQFDVMFLLAVTAYGLSAFALRDDLERYELITLLILPSFYTAAVFLFYFLLPDRWLSRLPIAILYGVGMYAILLTENIYNVSAERSIKLLRAAHSVGFLLTLVTAFFLLDMVFSLRLEFYQNSLLTMVIIFPLTLQALWSMELSRNISPMVIIGSLVISLLVTEVATILSFWPIKNTMLALFITAVFYSLVGMAQQNMVERLFSRTVREYLLVLVLVFILVLATASWGAGQKF